MKKNMGKTDRLLRLLIALVIAALYFTNIINGTLATVMLVLGAVFVLTSTISFCPMYVPFGMNTCKTRKAGH